MSLARRGLSALYSGRISRAWLRLGTRLAAAWCVVALVAGCAAPSPDPAGQRPWREGGKPVNPRLDSVLDQLVRAQRQGALAEVLPSPSIRSDRQRVAVNIEALPGQPVAPVRAAVAAGGGSVEHARDRVVTAWVPVAALPALAAHPSVRRISPSYTPELFGAPAR